MIFFVTVLRALAACLITNAHYTGIYPADIIANGGLFGDILFFAVSGYCLCNVKQELNVRGFGAWYGKRLWRVYPPVVVCTVVYILVGAYDIRANGFFWWFIYPTYYHFVGSIVVLYVPFFFLMKIRILRDNIVKVMVGIAAVWLSVYLFGYDKSHYHIDTVREPMIRFLFMESMLLGAWFRINDGKLRNIGSRWNWLATAVLFVLYFVSKLAFSRYAGLSSYQFLNQIIIFALLFFVFKSLCGVDKKLEGMPGKVKKAINFISSITLEIYVVQYVLVSVIRGMRLAFPLSWLILTASIVASAFALHTCCGLIYKGADCVVGDLVHKLVDYRNAE